jgi:hypothetical protein
VASFRTVVAIHKYALDGQTERSANGFCIILVYRFTATTFIRWPFHPAGYWINRSFGLFRL